MLTLLYDQVTSNSLEGCKGEQIIINHIPTGSPSHDRPINGRIFTHVALLIDMRPQALQHMVPALRSRLGSQLAYHARQPRPPRAS